MMKRIKTIVGFVLLLSASYCSSLYGQGFIENFDYDPGNISNTSNGAWTSLSGTGSEIQIENCRCQLSGLGGRDAFRPLGSVVDHDVWFYSVEIFVSGIDNHPVSTLEFIHFTDGAISSLGACLSIEPPKNANKDFGLSIGASSASTNQTVWIDDFDFQDRVVAVVRLNNRTGTATLWANPQLIDSPEKENPSVENVEPGFSIASVENLVLRQSGGDPNSGTFVTINRMATGLDFLSVLLPLEIDFFIQLGDINRDCRVNLLDVSPFVDLLINEEYDAIADMNFDGEVNILDVQPFVDIITP